jgi:hypothetical protein
MTLTARGHVGSNRSLEIAVEVLAESESAEETTITTEKRLIAEYATLLNEISTYSLDFVGIHRYSSLHSIIPAISVVLGYDERKGETFIILGPAIRITTSEYHDVDNVVYDHESLSVKNLFDTDQRHPLLSS